MLCCLVSRATQGHIIVILHRLDTTTTTSNWKHIWKLHQWSSIVAQCLQSLLVMNLSSCVYWSMDWNVAGGWFSLISIFYWEIVKISVNMSLPAVTLTSLTLRSQDIVEWSRSWPDPVPQDLHHISPACHHQLSCFEVKIYQKKNDQREIFTI